MLWTIKNILKYNFNREERRKLFNLWLTNWCGWKWGFNFSEILKNNIKLLKNFSEFNNLARDINMICIEHDIEFIILRKRIFWFYKANFNFAKKLFLLLHWWDLFWRVSIFLITFFLLCKYWKPYFEKTEYLTLEEIYIKLKD